MYLPKSMGEKVTSEFRTRMGYASAYDGEVSHMTFNLGEGEYEFNSSYQEVDKAHGPNGVIIHLLDAPDGIAEDDQQPYSVLSDDEKTVIAAVIDSECIGYTKEGSLHTPEYHMCKEFLAEFCSDMFIECEGDLDKMYDRLNDARSRKAIGNVLVPKGAMTLLLGSKDAAKRVLTFQNKTNDLSIDAKEFWASRSLGWSEKPITATTSVPSAGKESLMDKLKREKAEREARGAAPGTGEQPEIRVDPSIGSKAPPPPKHPEDTKEKTKPTVNKDRVVTSKGIPVPNGIIVPDGSILVAMVNGAPLIVPKDTKLVEPPDDCYGKALDNFYKRNFTIKPDNIQSNRPALPAYLLKPQSAMRDFIGKSFGVLAFLRPNQTKEELDAELAKIEEDKKASFQPETTGGSREVPLFVPPRAAKDINKNIKDKPDTFRVQNKDEIEASLARGTPASKELGLPFEHMTRLSTRAVRDIGNTNIQTLVCMYQEVCGHLLKAQPELLNWKPEEKPVEVKEPTGTTTQERRENTKAVSNARVTEQKESLMDKLKREKAEREERAKAA